MARKRTRPNFWTKVEVGEIDECWPTKYSTTREGYGQVTIDGQNISVHRYAFYLSEGYIPALVRHTCDNKVCCNPFHLVEGTHQENMNDMVSRNRQARGKDAGAGARRLTEQEVLEIRATGSRVSQRKLGVQYGVSHETIGRALRRVDWKWLP